MRIAVVGAGIAGAMLAWRLRHVRPRDHLTLYTGGAGAPDATAASGGMVRGYDPDLATSLLAGESLAELYADGLWRGWSGYAEIGSLYVLAGDAEPGEAVRATDQRIPGSVTVLDHRLLRAAGLRGLPAGARAVAERRAGHVSPARWRSTVVERLPGRGVAVHDETVQAVSPGPRLTLTDGRRVRQDAVVVAAGAWTPALLRAGALPSVPLRTKQIQYTVSLARLPLGGGFVDDTSGLYGRPLSPGVVLLGLPTPRWDVDPGDMAVDHALVADVVEAAWRRFGVRIAPAQTTASADCYADAGGLALRECGAGVFTFTGGSGGAVKTVLAASRNAAATLSDRCSG